MLYFKVLTVVLSLVSTEVYKKVSLTSVRLLTCISSCKAKIIIIYLYNVSLYAFIHSNFNSIFYKIYDQILEPKLS